MTWKPKYSVVLLLVAVAAAAAVFRWLVPTLIAEYDQVERFSPTWAYVYLAVVAIGGAAFSILVGWSLWALAANTRAKIVRRCSTSRNPSQMSAAEQRAEIAERLSEGRTLVNDDTLAVDLRQPIRRSLDALETKLDREALEIVAFGTVSSGKSSLLNALAGRDVFRTDVQAGTTVARNEIPWPGADRVTLVDTPGLAEIGGSQREELAQHAARDADLVLFVTDGPLKDFEFAFIEQLAAMEKRVLVCLNKEDWYRADDRDLLVEQIAGQVAEWVPRENVIALCARPATRRANARSARWHARRRVGRGRARHPRLGRAHAGGRGPRRPRSAVGQSALAIAGPGGRSQGPRAHRARHACRGDRRSLRLAGRRRRRAQPVAGRRHRRRAWHHLAHGRAIGARLSAEDGFLDTAGQLIGQLGKQLVSIAGANVAAPLTASALASLLKTVPGVGTIAGGALQGLVQVLVTRWIGGVFIEYFRGEMCLPAAGWASLARAQWDRVTKPAELSNMVRAGLAQWEEKRHDRSATTARRRAR